jgi:hypothetical protein
MTREGQRELRQVMDVNLYERDACLALRAMGTSTAPVLAGKAWTSLPVACTCPWT